MSDKKLDALLKTDDSSTVSLENSKKFNATKRKINGICKALCKETKDYNPKITVDNIEAYIGSANKMERILYSEISNFVFGLDVPGRGVFATNIEKLLLYVLDDENTVNEDCKKLTIKIYDHFQLALCQIENVNNIFAESIEEAKVNLSREIKGVEKEYISILGIFAAIVLAFVGGITFSSSVLQNIDSVSIYRLLLVIDLLAFVLINTIFLLVRFIFEINDKDVSNFKIKWINGACFGFAIIVIVGWLLKLRELPDFIANFLPWC